MTGWNLPPGCTDRHVDEAAGGYDEPQPERCSVCDGSGEVARFVHFPCGYAGPSPVPKDARGVTPCICEACNGAGWFEEGAP